MRSGKESPDARPAAMTAIVPATNSPATLARCLQAIQEADDAPEQVLVITEPAHSGPAKARNAAARRATGDVLVFIDADVVVHRDAFTRIRARFQADPGLTAVFGSYDDRPEVPGLVSRFRNLLHHHVHQTSRGASSSFWAGLGAIRRDAFLGSGGFDAQRFGRPCVEDIELGMRLSAGGCRIELDPDVLGTHLKGWTFRTMLRTDLRHRGIPWTALMLQKGKVASQLNLAWAHRVSALLSILVVAALLAAPVAPLEAALGAAGGGLAGIAALHRSFLALLARKGARLAALGLPLLVLHYLAAAASVPPGIALGLRWRRQSRPAFRVLAPTTEPVPGLDLMTAFGVAAPATAGHASPMTNMSASPAPLDLRHGG